MVKNKLLIIILFVMAVLLFVNTGHCAVLLSDDFETSAADFACDNNDDIPNANWTDGYMNCGVTAGFGQEFKMGTGRGGAGNAMYCWKNNLTALGGYRCYLGNANIGGSKRNIYTRWYMKIPTAANYDKTIEAWKWWRFFTSGSSEYYFNSAPGTGGKLSTGNFVSVTNSLLDMGVAMSEVQDDAWHCYEVRTQLNTTGASNGIIQFWLDGVLKYTNNAVSFGGGTSDVVTTVLFGIGNTSEGVGMDQTSWQGVGFDDIVIADAYVGPIDSSPTLNTVTIGTNGTSWTFVYDRAMTCATTSNCCDDYAVTTSTQGAITLSYASGSTTGTIVCSGSPTVQSGETITAGLDYTTVANGIEDDSGDDLASINDHAVVNNSIQEAVAPTMSTAIIASNGTTLTLNYNEIVSQGAAYSDSDIDVDCTTAGQNIAITYSSGSGSTAHIYTLASTVNADDTCNIDFSGTANSLEDQVGNDLAAIVSGAVTNNSTQGQGGAGTLLEEGFDDTSYESRGWYDYTDPIIDTTTKYSGAGSLRHNWTNGSNGPTGIIRRHAFTPSDHIYVSYWVRFSSGWTDFGANSPHILYVQTDVDDAYASLAYNKTTAYIELNGSASTNVHIPTVKLQDSENIDVANQGENICATSETRGVNGCNGDCDGQGTTSCYQETDWYNGRVFASANEYAPDTAWHHVEAWIKMNTISGSVAQADGEYKMWFDDTAELSYENIIIRTNEFPNMKWDKVIIAPWGSAAPQAQTMWIDELTITTEEPHVTDETAPTLSNLLPSGSIPFATPQTLSVTTNENATCRYSSNVAHAWADMAAMAATGLTTTHTQGVTVEASTAYTYYVICQDASSNESDKGTITFSMATSEPPSVNVNPSGTGSVTFGTGGTMLLAP